MARGGRIINYSTNTTHMHIKENCNNTIPKLVVSLAPTGMYA